METMTGARRRILVVEDDPETARQLVDYLTIHGYRADLATNGNDGLQLGLPATIALRRSIVCFQGWTESPLFGNCETLGSLRPP
jgi:DNA-binding NtrC family response regulator